MLAMYVAGPVIPVAEDKKDAYRQWAERGAELFRDHDCIEIVESWEDFDARRLILGCFEPLHIMGR